MSLIEEALRKVQHPLPGDGTRRAPKPQKPKVQAPPAVLEPPAELAPAHSWPADAPTTQPAPAARTTRAAQPPSLPSILSDPRTRIMAAAAGMTLLLALGTIGVFRWARAARTPAPAVTPVPALKAGDTNLVLTGVVLGVGDPYAVINGEILAVGDTIAGATVQEIAPGAVTLRLPDGREAALRVPR